MSRPVKILVAALLTTAVVVGLGVVLGLGGDVDDDPAAPPAPPPTVPSTPLADYDTSTVAVQRDAFCDAVAPESVERALGAPPTDQTVYADGQPTQLTDDVRDVSHEYGCTWTSATTTARAWVFAPPVTPAEAADLVAAAREVKGCRSPSDAPDFGSRSVALVCPAERGLEVSFRGLFGDAWLACSVSGVTDRADAVDRAGRWCVAAATAASS